MDATEARHESKTKILDAALHVFRSKGYCATRIEDVCEEAGLTKGSFFHHFKSKEDLALGAAQHWNEVTGAFFESAPYRLQTTPLDRLLAYVDFRKAILRGELSEFTCLAGTMVQEIYETHPAIREACAKSISGHAATLEQDIVDAMRDAGIPEGDPNVPWSAQSLALYTQAVIQGSFVLAKAKQTPEVAEACLDHLRRYLELLFSPTNYSRTNSV
jgi:TetR/AcrR family transcriptional repressor of nem operon